MELSNRHTYIFCQKNGESCYVFWELFSNWPTFEIQGFRLKYCLFLKKLKISGVLESTLQLDFKHWTKI